MERPSNIIISLHPKKLSIMTNIPLIISKLIVTIVVRHWLRFRPDGTVA